MGLQEQLTSDLKEAMKTKDKQRIEAIRSLKNMLRSREIQKKGELSEEDQMQVLSKAAKQRRESIESYEEGGRHDLVEQEKAELEVIEGYLPEQLSEDEIREKVDEVIEETEASTMQDMGRVMGTVMPQLQGKAEGDLVRRIVQEKLSS